MLLRPKFTKLPLNAFQARGWLLNQLKIQAQGLSGNLDLFWPDIKNSKWLGGSADGWERVPYWLDGFIPLAYLLNDANLISRAEKYITCIINKQQSDGWIAPEDENRQNYDLWAIFLILKVLVEFCDITNDTRIENVVEKALRAICRHIDSVPLFGWGQMRWFECLIPIYWLYERKPDDWLLNLAHKIRCQGFDWISFFRNWPYKTPDAKGHWSQMSHVVNNAMMLKSGPLLWRLIGDNNHLNAACDMVKQLDEYHGMITGVFTGDECLAGKSPIQGTELCAVVEYLYSLEHLIQITGDAKWASRLEKIAFNALPATCSPDMWTHQYDQQVNQVECTKQSNPVYLTNGGEANIFGLEPNFGCCTANLSQGWPKFATSTVMGCDGGLVVNSFSPVTVTVEIGGVKVILDINTEYPFREQITLRISTEKAVRFKLYLMLPEWLDKVELNFPNSYIDNGYLVIDQVWTDSTINLELKMPVKLHERPNNLYALSRGPLIYSLRIGEKWVQVNRDLPNHQYPHCDYEVHPTTPWNYGLVVNPNNLTESVTFTEKPLSNFPFSPAFAPVVGYVYGRRINWRLCNGAAEAAPEIYSVSQDIEKLELIPYGCTNLRITEFPLLDN